MKLATMYEKIHETMHRPHKVKKVLKECTSLYSINGLILALMVTPSLALANPQGGVVTGGSATITNTSSELQINQTSNRALIDWSSFNIGAGETTRFYQPGSSSIAINRVTTSGQVSTINGNLTANGQIVIINPNGVLIGQNGNINTAGFVATTANIDDSSFINGTGAINFNHAGNADAVVENQGHITVGQEGLAGLVAPTVRNSGVITGNLGKVQLAAADTFSVDFYGDGLINFAVNPPTDSSIRKISVENTGSIIADGGKVLMTAAAASDVIDSSINTSGYVQAHSLVNNNGEIILTGAGANVTVSGTVDASGTTGNGGTIKIGGDTQGTGTLAHAATVNVNNAVITADAGTNGNGGNITIWSDNETDTAGILSARGGLQGGNGGNIETSSEGVLNIGNSTFVDTSAPQGAYGTWLVDPVLTNLNITSSNVLPYETTTSNVVLSATNSVSISNTVLNQIHPGVSVTVTAGSGGINLTNGGIITTNAPISLTSTGGAVSLNHSTLFSQGGEVSVNGSSITINNNSGIGTDSTSTQGSITLTSSGQIDIENSHIDSSSVNSGTTGHVNITPNPWQQNGQTTVTSGANGGTITINGGGGVKLNSDCISAGGSPTCTVLPPLPTLTLTADNQIMTYGGTLPTLTYSETTSESSTPTLTTQPTLTTTGTSSSNVGSYPINIFGAVDYNYFIKYVNGTLTINPAALTITANNESKTYGQTFTFAANGAGEYTVSGLVNGNTVSSVTLGSTGAAATAQVSGSPYAITASGATGTGLSNYTIGYVNGLLTINPAALTITANNESKTYGQTFTFAPNGTGEYTVSGLLNGNTVSSVTLGSTGAAATAQVAGSPYAITASGATGTGLTNYLINYVSGLLTINPAALTITADNESKTYGQTFTFAPNGTGQYTASGLLNGDTVSSVTLGSTGAAATAQVSGSPYAITASGATGTGIGNYLINYVSGLLTINPAALTITADNESKTYGQTFTFAANGAGQYTTSGLVNGDTVSSVTLASTGAAATAQVSGSPYAITASGATGTGLSNYTIGYVNGLLTINKAALTVTADNQTKTYGNTFTFAANGAGEYTTSGLVNGDTVSSVTLGSTGAAATAQVAGSPYAITASGATGTGLSNYTIGYVNGLLTINPAALTITADNESKTYGQTFTFAPNGAGQYTTSGLVNGDTVSSVSLTSTGAAATAQVSGSPYAITASGATGTGLSNYTIGYVNGLLTINPAALTITADNQTKTYGNTFTFNGTEYTTSGLVNGDTVSSVTLGSTGAAATAQVAGSPYVITASGATGTGLSNYTIGYVNGLLTINPAALTITADNQTKTYGNTFTFNGTEYTTSGLVNGDTVSSISLTSTGAPAAAGAGSYPIVASGATGTGLSNYTIGYVNGTLTVGNAILTITADNKSKTYGDINPTLTASYSGFLNGDTAASLTTGPTLGTTATTGSHVGFYTITASGAVDPNYTIVYVNGTLTINPAALTITADNQSMNYGGPLPTLTASYSGFVNGDTAASLTTAPTLSTTATASSHVSGSPYTITASGAVDADYIIGYVPGALTINPVALTITADNQNMTYGGTVPTLTASYSGFVNGDTAASLTTGPTLSTTATSSSPVSGSPYPITASGAVDADYTIGYVNGQLTINPAALTITADNQSKIYGDTFTFNGTEFSTSGLLNSDTVTSATLTSTGAPATAGVGSYGIAASGALGSGLSNYIINYVNGTLAVNPAALTITADNQSKTAGQTFTFNGTEFTTSGLKNNDTVTSATITSTGAPAAATVGSYPIDISNAIGTGLGGEISNYNITYIPGTMTIGAAPITPVIPAFQIGPLDRPIVSVDNGALIEIPPFKPYNTTGVQTVDVSIKNPTGNGPFTPGALASLSPAAGGNSPEYLANLSPSAGGNASGSSVPRSISCANGFLDNKSCDMASY